MPPYPSTLAQNTRPAYKLQVRNPYESRDLFGMAPTSSPETRLTAKHGR